MHDAYLAAAAAGLLDALVALGDPAEEPQALSSTAMEPIARDRRTAVATAVQMIAAAIASRGCIGNASTPATETAASTMNALIAPGR